MNKMHGVMLGILAFCIFSALVSAASKKSPRQIAQEQCAEVKRTAGAFGVNPSTTIFVSGTAYSCE